MPHTRPMVGEMKREYMPSGAQTPPLSQVVPPSKTSTTAATPTAKSALDICRARQSPNAADMISIARGNELNTKPAQWTEFYAHPFTQAEGDFRRALAIDPTYGPAQEGLAHVYEHEGRYDEAITEWQKSIVSFGLPTMVSRVAQDYRKGGTRPSPSP